LIIMDISMPGISGVEATRAIKEENAQVKILALSMHAHKQFIRSILEAGASGYLLKSSISDEIKEAIQTVMDGKEYISAKIADMVLQDYVEQLRDQDGGIGMLSPRELQVFRFLAAGKRTKEIAFDLGLSPRTVEVYRAQIMKKLNLDSMVDLIKFAIRQGVISIDE